MKGLTYRLEEESLFGEVKDSYTLLRLNQGREKSIVWPDKNMMIAYSQQRATATAHAWINYSQMNRAPREIGTARLQSHGASENVLRRNSMSDVDDPGIRIHR